MHCASSVCPSVSCLSITQEQKTVESSKLTEKLSMSHLTCDPALRLESQSSKSHGHVMFRYEVCQEGCTNIILGEIMEHLKCLEL